MSSLQATSSFRADGGLNKDESWVRVQTKTFSRWCNSHLSDRLLKINDLQCDLQTGVLLANLLEIISDKKIKFRGDPKMKLQCMENLNASLDFCTREGLKLVNIGAEDIYANNLKIILGLIWTIILRYQINKGIQEGSPKWLLLEWVKKQVKPYNVVEPRDFKTSWIDGQTLSALTDSLEPGTFPQAGWTKDPMNDTTNAMKTALDSYDIPQLMEPEDMVETPDELSIMTYVAQFRDYADKQAARLAYLRGVPNAANTYIDGPGLQGGHSDVETHFTIHAVNYQGDALTVGGHHFKVAVDGPNGALPVKVTDNNNGTYTCVYTPTDAGHHTASTQISAKPDLAFSAIPADTPLSHVKNSPSEFSVKASVGKGSSTAEGPGLEHPYTDVPTHFTITSRDKHGNPVPEGGADFKVHITGPSGDLHVVPVDQHNGQYRVDYTPTEKGPHVIAVSHADTPIQHSPFHVAVKPSVVPSKCTAEGKGLTDDANINTKPTDFVVTLRDKHGDVVPEGKADVAVAIHGPKGDVAPHVTNNDDGHFPVSYTPADAGNHHIAVTVDGQPIAGFPKDVHVKPCVVSSQSTVSGPGVEGGKVDKHGPFVIQARNEAGEPVQDGGFHFDVAVTGPHGPVANDGVHDNNNGTYNGGWTPSHSGPHDVSITGPDGAHVKGSPFHFTVVPQPHAGNSWVDGKGLTEGFDNEPAHFTVHLFDKNNEAVVDGNPDVSINGPSPVTPHVSNNGDGTYSVSYEADAPGDYHIAVLTTNDGEGQNVKGSPSTAKVIAGADAGHCALGIFSLTVTAVDKHGNAKTYGGDKFEVAISHRGSKQDESEAHVHSDAIDNEDGTYTARYELSGQGRFSVAVKLNGKHVKNSPFVSKLD